MWSGGVNSVYATKKYASISVATGATWNAETNTMGFTAVNGWQILFTALPSGDITTYTKIHATLSDMSDNIDNVRLRIKDTSDHYADYNLVSGENNIDLATLAAANPTCDFASIADITLWSPTSAKSEQTVDADHPASVVITDCYMEKPLSLSYDNAGVAEINITDIVATGGLSFNDKTGVVTTNGTSGSLIINFASAVDLSAMKSFSVTRSGVDDIIWYSNFKKSDNTNVHNTSNWYTSKFGISFDETQASRATDVTQIFFYSDGCSAKGNEESDDDYAARLATYKAKTFTISKVTITSDVVVCANAGETALNTLKYYKLSDNSEATPVWNIGKSTDTYYGDGNTDATYYVDLTAYSELRIYRDGQTPFRAFFFNSDATATNNYGNGDGSNSTPVTWNSTQKYYSIDLSQVEKYNDNKIYLRAIKSGSWGNNNVVNGIVAYSAPAANAAKYNFSGKGVKTAAVIAALADETVTYIDATGITAATTLTTTNPNCLIKANTGMVTNANNVIVSGNCANLELTDGYPFKTPVDFTAGSASYTTTIDAEAQAGTLCLPFKATIPAEGVTAYTLAYANGDKATATLVETTIPANTPVLLNGSGSQTFTGSSVAITAGAAKTSEAMTGVYESTTAPLNSFVLQKQDDNVGFFKVASNDITVSPFRAYMTAQTQGARLKIVYPGETTGISDATRLKEKGQMKNDIFDLQGRRVKTFKKGLYIVNGKKVIK